MTELGARVTGLDFSETMLARAQDKLAGRDWRFVQADAEAMAPLADASFDFAVTRHLAWTLTDPGAAYREWLRVLRPGGRLLIIDSNMRATPGPLVRARRWLADRLEGPRPGRVGADHAEHRAILDAVAYSNGLDAARLNADLQDAGFTDVREVSVARLYSAGMRGHPLPARLRMTAFNRFALVARRPAG